MTVSPRIPRQAEQSATVAVVFTSGPMSPYRREIIASRGLAVTLERLAYIDADYVLIDTPPLLGVADAGVRATSVDGVLFVVNIEQTREPTLDAGVKALDPLPCRKLSVVVVGEHLDPTRRYHYGYGRSHSG